MIELHIKIKNALLKMDFIRRYEELSAHFSSERTPSSERLVYVEREYNQEFRVLSDVSCQRKIL